MKYRKHKPTIFGISIVASLLLLLPFAVRADLFSLDTATVNKHIQNLLGGVSKETYVRPLAETTVVPEPTAEEPVVDTAFEVTRVSPEISSFATRLGNGYTRFGAFARRAVATVPGSVMYGVAATSEGVTTSFEVFRIGVAETGEASARAYARATDAVSSALTFDIGIDFNRGRARSYVRRTGSLLDMPTPAENLEAQLPNSTTTKRGHDDRAELAADAMRSASASALGAFGTLGNGTSIATRASANALSAFSHGTNDFAAASVNTAVAAVRNSFKVSDGALDILTDGTFAAYDTTASVLSAFRDTLRSWLGVNDAVIVETPSPVVVTPVAPVLPSTTPVAPSIAPQQIVRNFITSGGGISTAQLDTAIDTAIDGLRAELMPQIRQAMRSPSNRDGSSSSGGTTVVSGDYLALTGGTLTGALTGTSATFSGALAVDTLDITSSTTFNGVEYLFPAADGASGEFLATDSAGGLTWTAAAGGIASLNGQADAVQTFASSSDTNIGISISSAGGVHTFTTAWNGVLSAARGGTGTSTIQANALLIGNSGGTDWTQVSTSSLGLPTFADITTSLGSYFTLSDWYATTTDGLDQGSTNLYNQTHTGEVTGSTGLTIADGVVDEANLKITGSPTDFYLLSASSTAAGGLEWVATSTLGFGTGDVVGPASATDNAIVRFEGTTGKLVQDSGIYITDGATPLLQLGGTSSTFPAWKRSNQNWDARTADDSDWSQVRAYGFEVMQGGTTNRKIVLFGTAPYEVLGLSSGMPFGWSSSATDGGTIDTGFARDSAGVVRVTNGSSGGGALMADYFTATSTATTTIPTLSVAGLLYDSVGTGGANGDVLMSTGSGLTWVATSTLGFTDTNEWTDGGAFDYDLENVYVGTSTEVVNQPLFAVGTSSALFSVAGTNGFVGIRDTTPSDFLDINTAGVVSGGIRLAGASVSKINFADSWYVGQDWNLGTYFSIGTAANDSAKFRLQTDGDLEIDTDTIFVDATNNRVGIGTTSPQSKLTVAGEVRAANFAATSTATSTIPTLSVTGLLYDGAGTGGANGDVLLSTGSGLTWVATSTLGLSGIGGTTGATDDAILIADGTGGSTAAASAATLTAAGVLTLPPGSAAAPALLSSLDSNTGLYFADAGGGSYKVGLSSNGSTYLEAGQDVVTINAPVVFTGLDSGINRYASGVVKITNGGAGYGSLIADKLTGGTAGSDLELTPVSGRYVKVNGTALWVNGPGSPKGDVWLGLYAGIAAPFDGILRATGGSGAGIAPILQTTFTQANTAGSGAPNAISDLFSGMVYTNEGSTAVNYHTLPAAASGYKFTFVVQDADGMRVVANTGDTIRIKGDTTAAAGYIESATVGSQVTLTAINATEWVAESVDGVWTDGTFTYNDTTSGSSEWVDAGSFVYPNDGDYASFPYLVSTSTATSTFAGGIEITGDIVPTAHNTYSLGATTSAWKDVFIGPGSLYINGQKVLEESADNIVVSADINQSLHLKVSGSGDIELNPTGTGLVALKGNMQITGGKVISSSDNSAILFEDGLRAGNLQFVTNTLSSTNTDGDIIIAPNGAGDTYFSTGKVGIGTSTPQSMLTVAGEVRAANFVATSTATSTIPTLSITGLLYDGAGTGGANGDVLMSTGSGLTWVATSTLGISGGSSEWTDGGAFVYPNDGDYASAPNFVATSTTATSTFAGGLAVETSGLVYDYATGKVGIGTASPNNPLSISFNDSATTLSGVSNSAIGILNPNTTNNSFSLLAFQTMDVGGTLSGVTRIGSQNVSHTAGSPSGDFLVETRNAGTWGEKLRVTAGGNVGIGTTSPYARLSVAGDTVLDGNLIRFASTSASTLRIDYSVAATSTIASNALYAWTLATSTTASPIIWIDTRSTGNKATTTIEGGFLVNSGAISYDYGSNVTSIENLNLGNLSFDTDAGVVSWVNLPITSATAGTPESYSAQIDDTSVLTVYGESNGSGGVQNTRVGIGTSTPWRTLSASGTVAFNGLTTAAGTPSALCLAAGGEVTVNTGAQTCTVSSLRFKSDVTELEGGLASVLALKPSAFVYNDASSTARIGLIAEEVALIDPRLVFYEPDGVTPRGVRYEDTVALLVKAIQELNAKVDSMLALAGASINNTVARFIEIITDKLTTRELCLEDVCITKTELQQLLDGANVEIPSGDVPNTSDAGTITPSDVGTTTPDVEGDTATTTDDGTATTTPDVPDVSASSTDETPLPPEEPPVVEEPAQEPTSPEPVVSEPTAPTEPVVDEQIL